MNIGMLDSICQESGIQFILICDGKVIYKSKEYIDLGNNICKKFTVANDEYMIKIIEEDKRALALLVHCIKNILLEINYKKDKIILDILEGHNVAKDDVIKTYPFMAKQCSIIVIYTEDSLEKVSELIEEGYKKVNTVRVLFQDKIIILGELDNTKEHAQSIRESLAYDFYGKCIICYSKVRKYSDLKEVFNMCNRKILIALKLNASQDVLGEKDLLFEEAIESISEENKKRLLKDFSPSFNKIDVQMFKTIEIFFKCGLNLSEASKQLFIHRNTLIYRLDKILKDTGFDLRDFNDAVLFKIISLIWKQYKN